MSKNCSKCELSLEIHNTNSIQVDYCKECRGVFLDYQEIQTLSENKDDLPAEISGLESQLQEPEKEFADKKCLCPKCDKPMRVKSEYGVEIDLCMFCGSLWFDSGELQAALHHFQQKAKEENRMDQVAQRILDKKLGFRMASTAPFSQMTPCWNRVE